MLKDIIKGIKLLRYGYRFWRYIFVMALFAVCGFIMEFSSNGTSVMGGVYFMGIALFIYQLSVSLDSSIYVQSSAMKRNVQINVPLFLSTVIYLIIFTVLIVERAASIKSHPQTGDKVLCTLFEVSLLIFVTLIYTILYYKYFMISILVFVGFIVAGVSYMKTLLNTHMAAVLSNFGLVGTAITGYIIILAGAALAYLIGSLIYRKPLSKFILSGMPKR